MKTEISSAARSSPLVVNCFYFGGAAGRCHHPVNATGRCGIAACAMLAADLRRDLLAISPVVEARLNGFADGR